MFGRVIVLCALAGTLGVPAVAVAAVPVQPPSPADGATVGQYDTLRYRWTLEPDDVQVIRVVFDRSPDAADDRRRADVRSTAGVVRLGRDVSLAPGTWYWRLCTQRTTDGEGTCGLETTAHRLNVRRAALPALSAADARRTATVAFTRRFGSSALRRASCGRNGTAQRCAVTMRVGGRTFTGRLNARLQSSTVVRYDWRITRGRAFFSGFGTIPLSQL